MSMSPAEFRICCGILLDLIFIDCLSEQLSMLDCHMRWGSIDAFAFSGKSLLLAYTTKKISFRLVSVLVVPLLNVVVPLISTSDRDLRNERTNEQTSEQIVKRGEAGRLTKRL